MGYRKISITIRIRVLFAARRVTSLQSEELHGSGQLAAKGYPHTQLLDISHRIR